MCSLDFALPYSHLLHKREQSVHYLVRVIVIYLEGNAGLHYHTLDSDLVEGMCKTSLHDRRRRMYPYNIHIHARNIRSKIRCHVRINPDLWDLLDVHTAGMDINTNVRPLYVLHDLCRCVLSHSSVLGTREQSVHINVKYRHIPVLRLKSHRIDKWIYIHDSSKLVKILLDPSDQVITYVLSGNLIPMYTGHNTQPLFISSWEIRSQMVLLHPHDFPDQHVS